MEIKTLGQYDMVIGEVVFFHFRADVINERNHTDVAKLDPVGRLPGKRLHARVRNRSACSSTPGAARYG